MIRSILNEESVTDLYEYNAKELLGKPLTLLVPQLNRASDMERVGFFGSATKRGAQFPIIIRPEEKRGGRLLLVENTVRITSIPVIAGLMTVNEKGIIEGCNDIFVKYLFGFSQQELLETHISLLLPQFTTLLANLKRDDLLQPGFIMNHIICRKLLSDNSDDTKESLPVIVAMHRDGTPFEVQLQLKLVDSNEIALWISFDREMVFKRSGHPLLLSSSLSSPPVPLLLSPPAEEASVHKKKAESEPEIFYSAQTKKTTIEDYTILSSLGQGAFGLVKLAVKKNDPSLVIFLFWFIFIL